MKELKCPKCGNVFQVDDAEYASIANQVKTQEFEAELERRIAEHQALYEAEQLLESTKVEKNFQENLNKKDQEIAQLKNELNNITTQKDSEMTLALAEKDKKIAELNAAIDQGESKLKIAVMEEQKRSQQVIEEKNTEITKLKSDVELKQLKAKEDAEKLIARYKLELQVKQDQIDYYKDLKTRMSTKMVGETLETHCSTLFNQLLRPFMPNAYFEKDNEVLEGTKGDFIFRDYDDDTEYVSIMFEMKNEADTTATKHKNEDFFKKLDEDRRKKKCEFAVLVSLLEPESELYNGGIVDVSHRYEKMYVIRPQFFVPFITLIVQTSKKSLDYKKQLVLAQSKEVDVTNFENKLIDFKNKFGRHYELASKKFGDAVKQIDEAIAKLQKIRDNLVGSENNLRLANQDTEELTIRRLTYGNPTMKQKFEEAKGLSSKD